MEKNEAKKKANSETTNNLAELDKKVIIKEKKEGNKNKTYVTGITAIDGVTDKKTAEEFAKRLKTKFGCGCKVDNTEDSTNLQLIFQGNHKDKVYRYIKDNFPNVVVQ